MSSGDSVRPEIGFPDFDRVDIRAGTIVEAVELASATYADKAKWKKLVRNGMATDVSWGASAGRYPDQC